MREWFAVVVKLLLTRSVYSLVYGQRKESYNVGVSTWQTQWAKTTKDQQQIVLPKHKGKIKKKDSS